MSTRPDHQHADVSGGFWIAPALVLLAGLVVLLSGAVLFYEGSEIFILTAEYGIGAAVFEKPLRSSWLALLVPLLIARRLTDDVDLLSVVFAAPYALLPAAAVLFVVLSLRRRHDSIAVALIGMCLVPLTWQLFFAAPWSLVNQLTWVLLACVVRRDESKPFRILGSVVAGILFFTHALSFLTFVSIGIALFALPRTARTAFMARGFLLLGLLRLVAVVQAGSEHLRLTRLLGVNRYELIDGFRHPGAAFVGLYLALLVASAAVLLLARPSRRWLSVGLQAAAALSLWAYFTVNPRPWLQGVDYHYWSFAIFPPLVFIFLSLSRPEAGPALSQPDHSRTASHVAPALVFLVVMSIGAAGFRREMSRLSDAVARSAPGCAAVSGLPAEFSGYPLYGFVFANNFVAWAGTRQPDRVLTDQTCADACWSPTPEEHHLFDFGALPRVPRPGGRCATTLNELYR